MSSVYSINSKFHHRKYHHSDEILHNIIHKNEFDSDIINKIIYKANIEKVNLNKKINSLSNNNNHIGINNLNNEIINSNEILLPKNKTKINGNLSDVSSDYTNINSHNKHDIRHKIKNYHKNHHINNKNINENNLYNIVSMNLNSNNAVEYYNEENSELKYKKIETELKKLERIVHIDLKGAQPKVQYFKDFFKLIRDFGATGILLEYEDVFPYTGIKNYNFNF